MPEYAKKERAAQSSSKNGYISNRPAKSAPTRPFSGFVSEAGKDLASFCELSDQHAISLEGMHLGHDFSKIRVMDASRKTMLPVSEPGNGPVQAKLTINQPGDKYEQEADRIAELVMRMPEPRIVNRPGTTQPPLMQRSCPKCKKNANERQDEEERLQLMPVFGARLGRSGAQATPYSVPPIVHEVLRTPGQPLDGATRTFMEPRFGHDFSHVRVHTDRKAAESASAINARAYTVGHNVVFGERQYQQSALSKNGLLAHELAHVVQQSSSTSSSSRPISMGIRHDAAERKTEHMTEHVVTDLPVAINLKTSGILRLYGHDMNTCSQEDLETLIWPGNDLAREMVVDSIAALLINPLPKFVTDLFKRYFMVEDPFVDVILRGFEALKSKFDSPDYFYQCRDNCDSNPENPTLGMTKVSKLLGGSGPIILCVNNLKSATIDKRKTTAATIIHEFAHRYLGFSGDTYCGWECVGLDHEGALKNPDSYSNFASEVREKKVVQSIKSSHSPKP